MTPTSSNVYISAAFNRVSHTADWASLPTSTLAYASNKSIGIWSQPGHASSPAAQVSNLIQTGFSKSISSLKFAALDISDTPAIVAGSADGSIAIWTHSPTSTDRIDSISGHGWTKIHSLKAVHQGSVSALGVIRPSIDGNTASVIVSGASDGRLKVWSVTQDQLTCVQEIDLHGSFPLDIALLPLPSTQQHPSTPRLLMAVATTTKKIDLYVSDLPSNSGARQSQFRHKLAIEGHEDWIKSLDLCCTRTALPEEDGLASESESARDTLMLASGSQDGSVRLWKIAPVATPSSPEQTGSQAMSDASGRRGEEEQDEFEKMVSKIEADRMNQDGEISTRAYPFSVAHESQNETGKEERWAVTFDALLIGHDGWVTGVRWHPAVRDLSSGRLEQPAAILSSSADNSLILWTPSGRAPTETSTCPFSSFDQSLLSSGGARRARGPTSHHLASSIWMPSQRFGEVGGASNLGFFGALWKPSPPPSSPALTKDAPLSAVVAHGWGGSAHIWTLDRRNAPWKVASPVTGHFGPARSVVWEPCGEYFISCSDDQTTRLHAQPRSVAGSSKETTSTSTSTSTSTWHEIARPQSHGYDLHSVSWLDRLNFVSAADEKVLRVFSAPQGFVGTVGPHGLDCARLGSEDDSRRGIPGSSGVHTLLHLEIDGIVGLLGSARRHGDMVRQTMQSHFESQSDSLIVTVASDVFQHPFESQHISFKQLELYLKWLYAQAWSVAVSKKLMLAEITILPVPTSSRQRVLQTLLPGATQVAVDASDATAREALQSSLDSQGSAISPIQLSSDIPYDQNPPTTVGQDDAKGIKMYRVVALGGTFDHLHVGHKILLSMASLIATERIIVGVTDDAMLTKKSNAHLLEDISSRIRSVEAFIGLVRLGFSPLRRSVVKLEDVAGPAATEVDLEALVVTDETLSGADFIDAKRKENTLNSLDNWVIGVVGSEGQTDLQGDAKALADSKIGSTAIRNWLGMLGPRYLSALETTKLYRTARDLALTSSRSGSSSGSGSDSTTMGSSAAASGADASRLGQDNVSSRPVGASVPPLGLSNRAVYEGASTMHDGPSESGQPIGSARESLSAVLHSPPSEEQLAVETLWPELEKLYGHGFELLWVSASPISPRFALSGTNDKESGTAGMTGGRFIASCCRATSEEHAVVRIHDRARNWKEIAVLGGHSLTITRIQWSLDSKYILTCSRDRSWRIFERVTSDSDSDLDSKSRDNPSSNVEETTTFRPFTGERSHARIIWDAAWSQDPSEMYTFATASRDKTVKVFSLVNRNHDSKASSQSQAEEAGSAAGPAKPFTEQATLKFEHAVTALAFGVGGVLVVGLESGGIIVLSRRGEDASSNRESSSWTQVLKLEDLAADQINQLSFRPPLPRDGDDAVLASASEDGIVRLIRLSNL
ncbi:WD40 repeat-like protein [Testicularia cyperi]|uniref:Elongator complex protein 2 n=1 Tax=Testicularia cyperi TaxID=1882483 RepID=A0A317XX48_9BASI|nr:WD40 repeat-like protein [Testicularia cyperi]